ncbi:MDR family MFS transporter [Allonocardiopsis opalescens]|uniref:EmrB/QacA subfamily drug resistance transporter n=1 Tax=Allonocardiopsis opalescens TaxID=1144618 RepID=A0A2T0Q006_9ACTN|nr:MDR family MFS transporter [Allonocardiopsis opalescens]PRX97114.1 EmrB/QacA subfamily drug resistance transporter [Allonocardiopsis opalescens]
MTSTAESPAPPPGTGAAADAAPAYLSHRQILTVMVGIMSGMMLAALDQSIVGTALPRIVSDLGGLDQLSWVVTAYLLTSTAVVPLWGKISDLYGRRLIFQVAIGIFIVGSLLAGLSQDMTQLIIFRAVQGVGGGGLMSIALAIIGDIIPPRDRGRYQGAFAAVFGISSVAGPLLGGFFTDGPGWQWIFYINVPIGIAALVVTSMALRIPTVRRQHSIDYLGAALIVASVTSLILYLDWRGPDHGWTEAGALALLAASVLLAALFVWAESRAKEPIIPLHLFRLSIFSLGNVFNALSGFAMFGGLVFLPLYLQAVQGMSPTVSGLAMLPAVVGIFITSIGSGQLISRTGRYKIYPIAGAAVLTVALLLLSTVATGTPYWQIALYSVLFGAGLGFTMQTVVTAIQNAVPRADMGSATSASMFFRQMGAAVGTTVAGVVMSTQLQNYLADSAPPGAAPASAEVDVNNIAAIQALPEPVHGIVLDAFSGAIGDVFLFSAPFVVLSLIVAFFIKEIPLAQRQSPADATAAAAH